jgi:hypothetical protein
MARSSSLAKRLLWESRLAQFCDSQFTVAEFCNRIGCSLKTFYYWKRKIEAATDSRGPAKSESRSFLPVVLSRPVSSSVSIRLPSGVVVRVPCEAVEAIKLVLEHAQSKVA